MKNISTDFKCPKCNSELSTNPKSNNIRCKNCRNNFIFGTEEEFIEHSRVWYERGPLNELLNSHIEILKSQKMKDHLIVQVMNLAGVVLQNYDEISKMTEPAKDYIDQDGFFYEMITTQPFLSVDQTPFIQSKIKEKYEKYKKMNIDTSKISIIILDMSDPIGNGGQPFLYNQTKFAYEIMQKFKQHFIIKPWYIKDLMELEDSEKVECEEWDKFGIPTQWIMTRYSIIENINNRVLGEEDKKWAFPFKITDFFEVYISPLKKSNVWYKHFKIKNQ